MSDNKISSNLVRATNVLKVDVKNATDESLGTIEEIVLDKTSGKAVYVVLTFGGFMGMGNKLFALPWSTIQYNEEKDCFILNVEKEKLKNAPGFESDNWPDMAEKSWGENINSYYGHSNSL